MQIQMEYFASLFHCRKFRAVFYCILLKTLGRNNLDIYQFTFFIIVVSFLLQEQYIFVHGAILDAIQSGTTEVAASNLANHFKKLTEFNKGHGDELLEDDFKVSFVSTSLKSYLSPPSVNFPFPNVRMSFFKSCSVYVEILLKYPCWSLSHSIKFVVRLNENMAQIWYHVKMSANINNGNSLHDQFCAIANPMRLLI